MLKRLSSLLLLASLPLATSCASAKYTYTPPAVGENEMLKVSVNQSQQKKDSLRIWLQMQNKTDQTLRIEPSASTASCDGTTVGGVRRVVIRTAAGFSVLPHAIKKVTMEYQGITPTGDVTLDFKNIVALGQSGTSQVQVLVPIGAKMNGMKKIDDEMAKEMPENTGESKY